MSEIACCYYYDEQRNRCNCYVNENLDELLVENAKLREQSERLFDKTLELATENDKLRRAFNETLIRLVAANDVAVSKYMDDEYLELLHKLGIEVDG